MRYILPALVLALAGCSGHSSNDAADQQAGTFDNAAEQSTANAAEMLHNRADAIRENGAVGTPQSDDAKQAPIPGPKPTITRTPPAESGK